MTSVSDWRDFYKQRAQELYQAEIADVAQFLVESWRHVHYVLVTVVTRGGDPDISCSGLGPKWQGEEFRCRLRVFPFQWESRVPQSQRNSKEREAGPEFAKHFAHRLSWRRPTISGILTFYVW